MTTSPAFQVALDFTLAEEGGYVNNPKDPGGETKFGISKRAYPNEDIKNLTRDRAIELYERDYWNACRCSGMHTAVAMVVFDTAVNCGVGAASRWVQRVAGVTQDGVIRSVTLAALNRIEQQQAVALILRERMFATMQTATWDSFKNGWSSRWFRLAVAAGGHINE